MAQNLPWRLESFLDSLIVELDRAQDTLAVKGVNRPLTYTVKDVALELQLFPQVQGDTILFSTARPGESGASKVSIQLGSITDRQIKEVTKKPITKDDVAIDLIEDIDEETRTTLRRIGVTSEGDIQRMQERNIDIKKVSNNKVDYQKLADLIGQSKRRGAAPAVSRVSVQKSDGRTVLRLAGNNLSAAAQAPGFPAALLNHAQVEVVSASDRELALAVPDGVLRPGSNQLAVALDRFSIIRMDLKH